MKGSKESPYGPVRLLSARNMRSLSVNDQKALETLLEELDYLETETRDKPTRDLLLSAIITECAERLLRQT